MMRSTHAIVALCACVAISAYGRPRAEAELLAQAGPAGQTAKTVPAVPANPQLEKLKRDAASDVESMKDLTQQMIDQVFSYGELAFQEVETSKYLTGILEKN